jgi:hypothetical protein
MVSQFVIPELHRVHIAWHDALLKPTGPEDQEFSQPADVDHIFQALADSGKKKIAIYVHGGLVSGESEFDKLPFHQNPENQILFNALNDEAYPIYFVWETGIKESIKSVATDWKEELADDPILFFKEKIAELAQTFLFKSIMKYLPKVLADKARIPDDGLGLAGRPEIKEAEIEENLDNLSSYEPSRVDYDEFDEQDKQKFLEKLSADDEFMTYLSQLEEAGGLGLAPHPDIETLWTNADQLMQALDADFQELPDAPVKLSLVEESDGVGLLPAFPLKKFGEFLGKLVFAVGTRFVNKEDHGFAATITEEFMRLTNLNRLGMLIWNQMKANAQEAYVTEDVDGIPHAGHYVIAKLAEYLVDHPDTQVSLIGHSAGAIHLSYFVEAADTYFNQPEHETLHDFQFSNLTLLAPGVNFETFQKVLDHHQRIKRLHIFTMLDEDEMRDALLAGYSKIRPVDTFLTGIYPCSLLYAVSGIAESEKHGDVPLLGLARHLDKERYRGKDQFVRDAHTLINGWSTETLPAVVWSHNSVNQGILEEEIKELARSGRFCAALKHGDFDNDPWTAASIVALLNI